MPSGVDLFHVVFKNVGGKDRGGGHEVYSCIDMCVSHAENVSDDLAGKLCLIFVVSDNAVFGAGDNSRVLYARLYAVLFYDFATGLENGIDRSSGFSVRKYYPAAVFPKEISVSA